jgi:hypothetical protein
MPITLRITCYKKQVLQFINFWRGFEPSILRSKFGAADHYTTPPGNLCYRLFRSVEGYEFQGFVPPCYDPTYCEADPPVPFYGNALYKNPPLGTLRYNDGETVTYTCQNSSK